MYDSDCFGALMFGNYERDVVFGGALRDHANIDLFPSNSTEDSSSHSWCSFHSGPDDSYDARVSLSDHLVNEALSQ